MKEVEIVENFVILAVKRAKLISTLMEAGDFYHYYELRQTKAHVEEFMMKDFPELEREYQSASTALYEMFYELKGGSGV